MKKAIAAIIVLSAAVGSFLAYAKYQDKKYFETIVPHVKNTSLRVNNVARYETDKDTHVTFKEVFESVTNDIAEIDKRLLEVQTVSPSDKKDETDKIVNYMKMSQALLRSISNKYRKVLALSVARDNADQRHRDLLDNTGYNPYLLRALQKAREEKYKALQEHNEAIQVVGSAAIALSAAKKKLSDWIPADALIDDDILSAVSTGNSTKEEIDNREVQAREEKEERTTTLAPISQLLRTKHCLTCHNIDKNLVGPSFKMVAARYADKPQAKEMLVNKVTKGGKGVWGELPMPPNNVTREEADALVTWVLNLKQSRPAEPMPKSFKTSPTFSDAQAPTH